MGGNRRWKRKEGERSGQKTQRKETAAAPDGDLQIDTSGGHRNG